jgi:hypothetical protein
MFYDVCLKQGSFRVSLFYFQINFSQSHKKCLQLFNNRCLLLALVIIINSSRGSFEV